MFLFGKKVIGTPPYVLVGLGNPGKQYENTRHNAGFAVIDALAKEYGISLKEKKFHAILGRGVIAGHRVLLLKPQTFMNKSGEAIAAALKFYNSEPEGRLIVIYDDISLPPGKLRIRTKGSAGGHNGIKNIIAHMKTQEFLRIKIGVGEKPKEWDLIDYVLGHFSKEEQFVMEEAGKQAVAVIPLLLEGKVEQAMNQIGIMQKE
ncbi:peptidyl-tRNA hydrolase [Clostridia bacterium]|nr:peptidyl-tRNA hydrolase [Clostridia bacterium]